MLAGYWGQPQVSESLESRNWKPSPEEPKPDHQERNHHIVSKHSHLVHLSYTPVPIPWNSTTKYYLPTYPNHLPLIPDHRTTQIDLNQQHLQPTTTPINNSSNTPLYHSPHLYHTATTPSLPPFSTAPHPASPHPTHPSSLRASYR